MSVDGILNLIKPRGGTSFQAVHLIRLWSGEQHVGHAGTLDPMATGVLPICLGQGTRIAQFLSNETKIYNADIMLGVTTDTYDATGTITEEHDITTVTLTQIENALETFRGSIKQKPPMYSAVKHAGKRLYHFAREGIEIERPSRIVQIITLELLDWHSPILTIRVECTKGTYIRTLAYDIGQALGCGAHMTDLIRLKCGPFCIEDGVTLPEIEDAFHNNYWQNYIYPLDTHLLNWRAAIVDQTTRKKIENGNSLELAVMTNNGKMSCLVESDMVNNAADYCRVYTLGGQLIAIMCREHDGKLWHPEKVFSRNKAELCS